MSDKPLNNRYRPIRLLGSGGFGETLLAEDTHMPSGRLCVIKRLKPLNGDLQTKQLIQQRFHREAAILESLSASNRRIPQLYAYFCEAGEFFLVEELIQGKTIAELVEQTGPLPDKAVKQLLIKILQVLDQVHTEGIIHRDLKPENIILRACDCQPVLIDFGAVKETMTGSSSSTTPVSMAIGTSGFMPPEQAAGQPVFASDLYSLGVTAIYMLTGKIPQQLEINPHTGAINWQQFAPGTNPALVAIIERSIQPNTTDRYTSVPEMLADLDTANITTATMTCQPIVVMSPSDRQPDSNFATVVSRPTVQSRSKLAHRLLPGPVATACGLLLVGAPIGFLLYLTKLEPPTTSKSQPVPEATTRPTSDSSNLTQKQNLQKLISTKACRRCNLSGVNLTRANLSGADLKGADLSGAVLSEANLFQAELQSSNLGKAKLDRANLYGARLNEADLGEADLGGANLSRAYLSDTNLGNANLVNANLDSARLSSTNLTAANLSHASLQNASLKRANLFQAQLTGANFTGAEFCSSSNSGCANLTSANLAGAVGVELKDRSGGRSN